MDGFLDSVCVSESYRVCSGELKRISEVSDDIFNGSCHHVD